MRRCGRGRVGVEGRDLSLLAGAAQDLVLASAPRAGRQKNHRIICLASLPPGRTTGEGDCARGAARAEAPGRPQRTRARTPSSPASVAARFRSRRLSAFPSAAASAAMPARAQGRGRRRRGSRRRREPGQSAVRTPERSGRARPRCAGGCCGCCGMRARAPAGPRGFPSSASASSGQPPRSKPEATDPAAAPSIPQKERSSAVSRRQAPARRSASAPAALRGGWAGGMSERETEVARCAHGCLGKALWQMQAWAPGFSEAGQRAGGGGVHTGGGSSGGGAPGPRNRRGRRRGSRRRRR